MANVIQGDYDALAETSREFIRQSDMTQQLNEAVARLIESVNSGGWIGVGADSFLNEMQELVMPAMLRLVSALQDASTATDKLVEFFHEAEEEAGRLFQGGEAGTGVGPGAGVGAGTQAGSGISERTAQAIKDVWAVINGILGIAGAADGLVSQIPRIGGQLAKFLKGAGPGLNMLGGIIEGITDVWSGKEDFFNGMGKGLFSGGVDVGLDLATGGIYGLVIAAGDLTSLGGQGMVALERFGFDNMNLDPGVRSALNSGLDHANDVFKGVRISETVGSLKGMIWDVGFRPGMNVINQGWQQGNPMEVLRGASMVAGNFGPMGAFNMAQNFISDPDAQSHFMDSGKQFLTNAGNLIVSLPQLENEITRLPLRMGVGAFNHAVNSIPMNPAWRSTLNDVSQTMAGAVNDAFIPTPMGIAGMGVQKAQEAWNSLFGGN